MSHVIKVGKKDYTLTLVPGVLFFNGKQVHAVCHHDRREIQVSDSVGPNERMVVVAEAVSRAWAERGDWMIPSIGSVE